MDFFIFLRARTPRRGGRGRRDDKSDRWQQLVLGKLPGHCIGTCYFGKSSLGSLPANFGGPCARNYYLLPGSRTCRWPTTLGPGIWNAVMDSLSGFSAGRLALPLIATVLLSVSLFRKYFPPPRSCNRTDVSVGKIFNIHANAMETRKLPQTGTRESSESGLWLDTG